MATRTIVTSQPDVACDVCERRLLRGENSDVFIAAGRRRVVCELCAPRAVHEGWLRESDDQSLSLPPLRPRRGRSLIDRFRQVGRPAPRGGGASAPFERDPDAQEEPRAYDFLDDGSTATAVPARRRAGSSDPSSPAVPGHEEPAAVGEGEGVAESHEPPSVLDRALETFNASEYPRRVAGVARSLGAPEINVRSAEHAASVVRILVAWELCWYRYEVDVDEPEAGAHVAAQGTELGELEREDRVVNALADDSGTLSLSPA
jgi:hypothetical protein